MELVIRVSLVFIFLWAMMRALGKRELAEMTAFELVLLVIVGDLVQQGITQNDTSVTGTIVVLSTLSLWVLALSYLSFRSKRGNDVVEGRPVVVVRDGHILDDVLATERVNTDELIASAREQGISDVRRIRCGILEPGGRFSFIVEDSAAVLSQMQRKAATESQGDA
jgi:uncharacterized membrane protein YcaP (DUF421 family)